MAIIKRYNGKAVVQVNPKVYICIDMETGDIKAKGNLAECSEALEEV